MPRRTLAWLPDPAARRGPAGRHGPAARKSGCVQPPGLTLLLTSDAERFVVLTTRGLFARVGDGWEMVAPAPAPEPAPRCLRRTPDGAWWLGSDRGVLRLASGGWEQAGERPGPLLTPVSDLVVLDGTLWVATEEGLWERRPEGGRKRPGWGAIRVLGGWRSEGVCGWRGRMALDASRQGRMEWGRGGRRGIRGWGAGW